jgi:acetate kinase
LKTLDVLALNSGSSSLKVGFFRMTDGSSEALFAESLPAADLQESMAGVTQALSMANMAAPDVIGHRVVHGGPALRKHCVIDEQVLREIRSAGVFAPLHTPAALTAIEYAQRNFPGIPQVACFDTSFHAQLPDVARVLPIPLELRSAGIQRYGFHGLSLESIVRQLRDKLPERMVIAHLGNGASVTAVQNGRSIDTSMGLTPAGGVIMGTRSGDIDPGVLLYLMRHQQRDVAQLAALIDEQSGLLGISGLSGDMRRLHVAAPTNPDARLAIEMFAASVRKQIAAMISVLNGLDLLVFTGGIGERDAAVRAAICAGLSWIGIVLDAAANEAAVNPISHATSRCTVQVMTSREEEQIAWHAWSLLAGDQ